jgi:hypothetical protein
VRSNRNSRLSTADKVQAFRIDLWQKCGRVCYPKYNSQPRPYRGFSFGSRASWKLRGDILGPNDHAAAALKLTCLVFALHARSCLDAGGRLPRFRYPGEFWRKLESVALGYPPEVGTAPCRYDRAPILSGAVHLEDEPNIGVPGRELAMDEGVQELRFLDRRRAGVGFGFHGDGLSG